MPVNRILIVIRWPVGGIRTFMRYIYNQYNNGEYSFYLILPKLYEHSTIIKDLKDLNPTFVTLSPHAKSFMYLYTVIKVLVKYKIPLIHSHGLTAATYSFLPGIIFKKNHMITLHELLYKEDFRGKFGKIKLKILYLMLTKIKIIHTVSRDAKNNLIEFFPKLKNKEKELIVIPHGIDIEKFSKDTIRNLRKELALSDEYFLIGFMGRFMPVKGFKYLIDSLVILKKQSHKLPKKIKLITFGWGAYIREEMEIAKRKKVRDLIVCLPFTEDVQSTLKGLDVLVIPSIYESSGLLAMEAMVAGVPVIGTNCPGLRETLKDSPNQTVPVKNCSALAKAIITEINNPSRKKSAAYSKFAKKKFDAKNQAICLKEIYSKFFKKTKKSCSI
jgi:glycosyltransferase involved in cell wall biosynthesis